MRIIRIIRRWLPAFQGTSRGNADFIINIKNEKAPIKKAANLQNPPPLLWIQFISMIQSKFRTCHLALLAFFYAFLREDTHKKIEPLLGIGTTPLDLRGSYFFVIRWV